MAETQLQASLSGPAIPPRGRASSIHVAALPADAEFVAVHPVPPKLPEVEIQQVAFEPVANKSLGRLTQAGRLRESLQKIRYAFRPVLRKLRLTTPFESTATWGGGIGRVTKMPWLGLK